MNENKIMLTERLVEYLLELKDGPKATPDMVRSMMVSGNSVAKAMKKLRAAGLVESHTIPGTKGRQYMHNLADDYDVLMEQGRIVISGRRRTPISLEHIYYAAILKNDRWTGRELICQYQKVFPHKSKAAIKNIICKAQDMRLCR